ncbi:biotin-dependent carboxyltransferase family protein [Labrys monachus]|uniref:Biotin-dependent carboxylase-like uncharacterized protein n=1 Tax=Labrys monachus TaxID=217067 RepID=A0ABU0FGY9_9HYPH|nr:biotin-dependent carboxyltransferase family protein [Labrys monachus]MDQ0393874.1 biotin-dependent carboxylase-like uncharacterized protein [Labrys monachus]
MAEHLLVTDGGLFSTVQDLGRFGYQRFGISASGAMDAPAMGIANTLVGNPAGTAVIETTLKGPALTVEAQACRLALAGAEAPITVNGEAVSAYRAFDVKRGDRIVFGMAPSGMRSYLAIAGGLALEPVLGSRSTHSRSGVGGLDGRQLAAGDRLDLSMPAPSGPGLELAPDDRPKPDGAIRVLLGPQDDAFTPAGLEAFLTTPYVVSSRTDRMGCQLEGAVIEHKAGFNIVSDGIMNGSIQVPGHGRPIILLADRQTTGGYPKIATVIGPDLWKLAQARPGSSLRFAAVTADEAEIAAAAHRRQLADRLGRIAPVRDETHRLTSERLLGLNLISGVYGGEEDIPLQSPQT